MSSSSLTKFHKQFVKFTEDFSKELIEKSTEVLSLNKEDVEKLETELKLYLENNLNLTNNDKGKGKSSKKKSGEKTKRPPTKYNLFIQKKIIELKNNNPEIDRKELMRMAAKEWAIEKQKIN